MIHKERIKVLRGGPLSQGDYVLYWMQASQRADYNHALEFAVRQANDAGLPLVVYFGISEKYPDSNTRNCRFMLEGLKQTAAKLKAQGINFVIRQESPEEGIVKLSSKAALTVFDTGYMPVQKQWRGTAFQQIKTPVVQVESDIIVPVETASPKEEFAAYTIRPKITKLRDFFMQPLENHVVECKNNLQLESLDISDPEKVIKSLHLDNSVTAAEKYHPGGASEAQRRLKTFINDKLSSYAEMRNIPSEDFQSGLSPYIHFGQISPLQIALEVNKTGLPDAKDFLEELIIRRELAINFAHYNSSCQSYCSLPPWAIETLKEHRKDSREYLYSLDELEAGKTHDPCWNAAQQEMVVTGKMHGYMRMYWGKMILLWSRTPEEGFKRALQLNDKYELDGRDPNSCTGVAWCFGKHDRPWPSHPVLGKVRLMNQNGLKRKFDTNAYIAKIRDL
ncbi:deoxyribodipyrimidine photo-lyase [Lentisphaerota bacterium ZTH]|nr:deoxyribodipyrimidine photo-lyase [Lentisphaerota bacterium ZTH]